MKKVFSIIICGAVVAGFSSCKHEEDDIFNESSALRTNHAVATYSELLTSAENGWVMEYFANDEEPGYPMLVKFDANGAVTIAAKNHYSSNDVYATEESLYEVIADNGPVLSFNSYNTLFHIFADPADIPDTGTPENPDDETGLGHEGDYEFVIYEGDEDHFRMKGKKHGLEINMYKLPADQPWDTYYDKLDEIKAQMFSSQVQTLWMTVGDERYTITDMLDGLFSFVPEGGDPISQTVTIPYIVRLDGTVHLCSAFEGENENLSLQNFKVAEAGSSLNCIDEGQTASIIGPTAAEQIQNSSLEWVFDASDMGGAVAAAYSAAEAGAAGLGYSLDWIFTFDAITEQQALRFNLTDASGNVLTAMYYLSWEENADGGMTLKADGSGDSNSVPYSNAIPALKDFLMALASSYTVEVNSVLMPERLRFISKSSTDNYFVLTKPVEE